jgi:hypothetical protein
MIKKIVLILFVFASFLSAQVAPKVVIQPLEHNFGDIEQGKKVSHQFTLTNTGGSLLKIESVKASCGCTAADPEKNELKPNESTKLKVEFDSQGRKGKQTKYVYIATNDPDNKDLRVRITANITEPKKESAGLGNVPLIYFPETQHDFGVVNEGKVVDHTFKFLNQGKSPLEISDIKTSCGCTAALVSSKRIEPGTEGTIRVELDTKNRNGRMSRNVTIFSNDPNEPNKILTIFADVKKETSN